MQAYPSGHLKLRADWHGIAYVVEVDRHADGTAELIRNEEYRLADRDHRHRLAGMEFDEGRFSFYYVEHWPGVVDEIVIYLPDPDPKIEERAWLYRVTKQ